MEINRLLDEISTKAFEVGSWLWVDVTYINNPHSFYIRPTSYRKYLLLLQSRGSHPDPSQINIGDVFVFESKILKGNVRGKIIFCHESDEEIAYKLFAVDVGCTEDNVPLNRIWTTRYPLEVPSLVTHCQLADCAPRGKSWDHEAIDAMKNYVLGERAKLIIRSKTLKDIVVELYNSYADDVATLLALTNYTTFGYDNYTLSRIERPLSVSQYYTKKKLHVGEILHVRFQSGVLLEQFYVITLEDYQSYLNDRNNYTSYAKSQNDIIIEDLIVNAPIGVLYAKTYKFERGLVKEIYPELNRAKVQLVDWGIVIEESIMKMKTVPDWYLRVPIKTMWCTLHSSQSFSNNVASLSYRSAEFLITIKAVSNDHEDMLSPNVVLVSSLKSY